MTGGRDDDALSWSGDDDPTLDAGTAPVADTESAESESTQGGAAPSPTALPPGYTAVGRGSADLGRIPPPATAREPDAGLAGSEPAPREPMGNAMLITLGVLGGVYALFAVGWLIGGLRLQGRAQYLVTDVMFQGSLWIAVLAPVLWFGTTFLLTRASHAWVRIVWLAAGVVLLLPWPFVMVGAVGQ